ncbi:Cell morphogenesis protein [Podosphaera aphanis]|nr:Cell morphogenesis protein [Podosphaera aphanis]
MDPRSPPTLIVDIDVNSTHAKSAPSHGGGELNLNSSQTSPASFSSRFSPTDQQSVNASPRLLGGSRLAESKAHHRQTSIVNGYQHSRNGSFASASSSPISPQIIAASGGDRKDAFCMESSLATVVSSGIGGTPLSSVSTNSTIVPEKPSIAPEGGNQTSLPKKPSRIHTRTASRDHRRHQSHTRHHKEESKTVGEYALHVLFTSFIAQAEEKISQCITVPLDPEPNIDQICGHGVDPTFDQLISALGHIARQKPKPLIDSMMLWRRNKSDAASEARAQLQQSHQAPRRNTEPPLAPPEANILGNNQPTLAVRQQNVAQAERRSTVSIYILCRVLIEVISQSTLSCITLEMEEKLESIIFGQLKIADPEQLSNSSLRLANWFLFSRMLGVMGEINFKSVSQKFIADLEKSQRELVLKGPTNRESEGRIELVLGGMKYLRIKLHPEEAWDQSCDFMISLARLFAKAHGQRLKYAYCQALSILLLPVAARCDKLERELNTSKWSEVVGTIGPRLASMLVKPRHWPISFPLTAILLCVSPTETFTSQWLQLIVLSQPKLKDRFSRPVCLQAICRILWTYLYRTSSDPLNVTIRKLDEVIKLILSAGRKSYLTANLSSADPLIQIIRIIGFKHQDFCLKTIVFPLINADLFASGRDFKVEQLEPEKMVIGIRAFLAIISDLENGELGRPTFPQNFQPVPLYDRYPFSPILSAPNTDLIPSTNNKSGNDRFSQPVHAIALSEVTKGYYSKFCEILGKITIICDNTFGGQAVLDEKFNSPKTPLSESFNFARREDHQNPSEHKQGFYELLHVAVQALPRFLSADIPFNVLINLLCTGTAHVQLNIAESSAQSLRSIARQSHAQQVTIGFARFIFNFDDRYSTMSDGGMLGLAHIESTLKLYVELLQIWIEEIKLKTVEAAADSQEDKSTDKRGIHLDLSGIWAHVDEVEAHGLFFLCSQSRRVRAFAITVLRLIKEFDIALGKDSRRLIHILEEDSMRVIDSNDEHLSVAERSRLQRGMQKGNFQNALVELCSSETSYDTTLWLKVFPNLIRISYDRCPFAVTLGREIICNRILQMYKGIVALAEVSRGLQYGSFDRLEGSNARLSSKSSTTPPEVMIEQWKLYLTVACSTLSDKGIQQQQLTTQSTQHLRKGSKPSRIQEKILSARVLFKYIIPLLSVNSTSIRGSVVTSLGSINVNIYKTLLEELQGAVNQCNNDAKARIHQRSMSNPRRNRRTDLLRTEVTHVYQLTSHFLKNPEVNQDDWILNNLVVYTKDLKMFLMDGDVQADWEFQRLRRHYCGLMEELFEGINCTNDPSRWITFESRKSSFALMEDWCGFSPNQTQIRQREDNMRRSMIDHQLLSEQGTVTAAMEIEKRNLRTAALSAMAALCGGPLSFTTESRANLQFDIRRMLSWIDTILSAGSDRMHIIGRKALKNLITHNQDFPYLLEHSIARCYVAEQTKVLESYFEVVTQVLLENPDYPMPFWRLMSIGLFTLGNEMSEIRSKSAHLLRALEERQQRSSKIQDYDIRISDKTKAVYKLAQFEISKRLSMQYPELAFFIFSEFTAYFKDLQQASQRNMVAVILPWIQIIELQVDPNGGPTAQSYVLLSNLCEITIKSSGTLHNEVQALWQALATGPHAGNVRLVLDFIMSLCLDRREQNFVGYARQIVVFLSSTPAGVKVVEFLLMQITPKAMVPSEKRDLMPPPDTAKLPYLAELCTVLPVGSNPPGFSLGQLSLILLVDLMVSPVQLVAQNVPLLLQVVTVLWDHYIPTVQDQAHEMLIHIIHELVMSRISDDLMKLMKKAIEEFTESIRGHDPSVTWSYEDYIRRFQDSKNKLLDSENKVPRGMERLTAEIVKNFELTYPGIQNEWAKLSLTWATSCPVRHLACRSFQIFRCILTSLDQPMLADMLARLSNTVADDDIDVQTFSMEILTTLKTLICKLEPADLLLFPQLFWTICACLDTVNEREFCEALFMLEELMGKLDLNDSNVRATLADGRPPKWEGPFQGLHRMMYKGLRSSASLELSLKTLNKLTQCPDDDLIGDESRILFAVLANSPGFLHAIDEKSVDGENIRIADQLAKSAGLQGYSSLATILIDFTTLQYHASEDFLANLVYAIRDNFLPRWDFESLTFLMGLLTNSLAWFRQKAMRMLCVLIPEIDMRKPEIASHGPDLISPLLRLLQTEFCMQALEVLDQIMTMTGTSMDKQHLRMSMTRSSSKAIRKEYARIPSLFGIPEDTGWSIPVPAKYAETTRANVHTVFYTCQSAEYKNRETPPTPGIEFHIDDFQYGYFQAPERAETMMSDEGRGEGNIGDLVSKLDSLDGFFQDIMQTPTSGSKSPVEATSVEFSHEKFDLGAQLYDEQTLPILHQSLYTTASNTIFQNGFADMKPPQPNTMNPGAFHIASSSRTSMHLRSITSPSSPLSFPSSITTSMSDEDYTEVFSDGDDERTPTPGEGSFFLENIIRPLPQGIRSSVRRLTGGRSRENDRIRENLRNERKGIPKSPKVPKVPSTYLQKTLSPGQ